MNSACMPKMSPPSSASVGTPVAPSMPLLASSENPTLVQNLVGLEPVSYEGRWRVLPSSSLIDNSSASGGHNLSDSVGFGAGPFGSPSSLSLSLSLTSVEDRTSTPEKGANSNGLKTSPGSSDAAASVAIEKLQEICEKPVPVIFKEAKAEENLDQKANGAGKEDEVTSNGPFPCHLCSFFSESRDEFNAHVNSHYEFFCVRCDFMTKDEADYHFHLKTKHNLTPEAIEDEQGVRVPKVNSQGKVKTFRCKKCDFVCVTKEDFWHHTKDHIKPDKILQCPKCPFITEFKHHMDYHMRSHFGSKPFKCPSPNCRYTCVNKSMLASHMKSHINIYQYRCKNCSYVTKYCHSLKLHLRKYNHEPSTVLNPDGTPNPLPIIDVYGTRRGPKVKRTMDSTFATLTSMLPRNTVVSKVVTSASSTTTSLDRHDVSVRPATRDESIKCQICDFETASPEIFNNHMNYHDLTDSRTSPSQSLPDVKKMKTTATIFNSRGKHRKHSSKDRAMSEDTPTIAIHKSETRIRQRQPSLDDVHQHQLEYLNQLMMSNNMQHRLSSSLSSDLTTSPGSAASHSQPAISANLFVASSSNDWPRLYIEQMLTNYHKEKDEGQKTLTKSDEVQPSIKSELTGSEEAHPEADSELGNSVLDLSHASDSGDRAASVNSKNRRKGKAFRIKRQQQQLEKDLEVTRSNDNEETLQVTGPYICTVCGIAFSSSVMHSAHMMFHDKDEALKCSFCGLVSEDSVAFYLHTSKNPHSN